MRLEIVAEDRKRQKGPKVRTGCVTCKTRRVKCDETKPTCMRCRSVNYQCGGYVTKQKHKTKYGGKPLPALAPKTHTPSTQADSLRLNPFKQRFINDQEFHYFKVFCDTSAPHLSEYLDENLWTSVVLQASEQESFIRHAVIAVGALNMANIASTEPGSVEENEKSANVGHFEFALQQYGKSIQGIRKACQMAPKSKRLILIACLLAVCFEYSHGSNECAVAHVKNGINLLNDWFRSLSDRFLIDQKCFLPGIIEDELISIFSRMETDLFTWHEAFEAENFAMHPEAEKAAMEIAKGIPEQGFATLASARKYLDIIVRQVDWFLRLMCDHQWSMSKCPSKTKDFSPAILPGINKHDYTYIYKNGLASWRAVFPALLNQCIESGGNDFLLATALSLRQTCSNIAISCCFGPELAYDAYTADFQIALSLAQTLSDDATSSSTKSKSVFSLSTISSFLIRSLYFIATKCRDRSIRTSALYTLRSLRRREGIWDSCVTSKVAEIVIEYEHADKNRFVPDERRMRAIKISFDLHVRQGIMRYLTIERESTDASYAAHRVGFSW